MRIRLPIGSAQSRAEPAAARRPASRGIYRLFTDSGEPAVDADITHGRHAIIETVFADLIVGPLANLPSGRFGAKPVTGLWGNKE